MKLERYDIADPMPMVFSESTDVGIQVEKLLAAVRKLSDEILTGVCVISDEKSFLDSLDIYGLPKSIAKITGAKEPRRTKYMKDVQSALAELLLEANLIRFITDAHREFVVRCHARGHTTAFAVTQLLDLPEMAPLRNVLRSMHITDDAMKMYVNRLAYLRPTHVSFPEKYKVVWADEKRVMRGTLAPIPLRDADARIEVLSQNISMLTHQMEAIQAAHELDKNTEGRGKINDYVGALPKDDMDKLIKLNRAVLENVLAIQKIREAEGPPVLPSDGGVIEEEPEAG